LNIISARIVGHRHSKLKRREGFPQNAGNIASGMENALRNLHHDARS